MTIFSIVVISRRKILSYGAILDYALAFSGKIITVVLDCAKLWESQDWPSNICRHFIPDDGICISPNNGEKYCTQHINTPDISLVEFMNLVIEWVIVGTIEHLVSDDDTAHLNADQLAAIHAYDPNFFIHLDQNDHVKNKALEKMIRVTIHAENNDACRWYKDNKVSYYQKLCDDIIRTAEFVKKL